MYINTCKYLSMDFHHQYPALNGGPPVFFVFAV